MPLVNVKRAWAIGGYYFRPQNNPNEVPDRFMDQLPRSAEQVDGKAPKKEEKKDEPKALSELNKDSIAPKDEKKG